MYNLNDKEHGTGLRKQDEQEIILRSYLISSFSESSIRLPNQTQSSRILYINTKQAISFPASISSLMYFSRRVTNYFVPYFVTSSSTSPIYSFSASADDVPRLMNCSQRLYLALPYPRQPY